ncbi:MAG: hypothetical protein AAF571_14765 [Verrucomicrobiota bacterium]
MKYFLALLLFTTLVLGCATVPRPYSESVIESYELIVVPAFEEPDRFFVERTKDGYFLSRQFYQRYKKWDFRKFQSPKTKYLRNYQWDSVSNLIQDGGFWTDAVQNVKGMGMRDGSYYAIMDGDTFYLTGSLNGDKKSVEQYGEPSEIMYSLHERLVFLWEKGRTSDW